MGPSFASETYLVMKKFLKNFIDRIIKVKTITPELNEGVDTTIEVPNMVFQTGGTVIFADMLDSKRNKIPFFKR